MAIISVYGGKPVSVNVFSALIYGYGFIMLCIFHAEDGKPYGKSGFAFIGLLFSEEPSRYSYEIVRVVPAEQKMFVFFYRLSRSGRNYREKGTSRAGSVPAAGSAATT